MMTCHLMKIYSSHAELRVLAPNCPTLFNRKVHCYTRTILVDKSSFKRFYSTPLHPRNWTPKNTFLGGGYVEFPGCKPPKIHQKIHGLRHPWQHSNIHPLHPSDLLIPATLADLHWSVHAHSHAVASGFQTWVKASDVWNIWLPIGSMGRTVCLPTWMVDFYGMCGKYTIYWPDDNISPT